MNTSETGASSGKLLLELAKDHLQLASLEWEFERQKWWRRLLVRGGGATFLVSAYVFFHIALLQGLRSHGLSWVTIGIALGFVYLVVGAGIFWLSAKGEADAGPAFDGSREELQRTYRWIERLFS